MGPVAIEFFYIVQIVLEFQEADTVLHRREESLPIFKRRLLGSLLDFTARELQNQVMLISLLQKFLFLVGHIGFSVLLLVFFSFAYIFCFLLPVLSSCLVWQ